MTIMGKRVQVITFRLEDWQHGAKKGYAIGLDALNDALVVLDNGEAVPLGLQILEEYTEGNAHPAHNLNLIQATTPAEQSKAVRNLATVYDFKTAIDAQVKTIEDEIKARQAAIAEQMRSDNAALYQQQQTTNQIYDLMADRVKHDACSLWKPGQAKTSDGVQIRIKSEAVVRDEAAALAWCEANAKVFIQPARLDSAKFREAIKANLISPPANIGGMQTETTAVIIEKGLKLLAEEQPIRPKGL